MCGITGFVRWEGSSAPDAEIVAMTATLVHRGPDAGDVWVDDLAGVALGHRRLAIVELSERGAQPMHSACGRYVLTFNGEIYNHLDLRAELDAGAPMNWRGTSDTETLLACFAAWGVEATLKRAVGMFAFGLWDRSERRLTLARDRFGEKPLYYGWLGQGRATVFAFGSELKALKANRSFDNAINRDALALFLRFCYVPAPYSIFRDVFKLEPGTILTLDAENLLSRQIETRSYWSPVQAALDGLANPVRDEHDALEELRKLLGQSVRGQLMSDVPLGAFLSGGVDSSTIVALMQELSSRPVKTFTVGFDDAAFNEAPYADAVARHLGTEHYEIHVSPKETLAVIPDLPLSYDEPFADSSQIPTSIMCAFARKHVTVALSGDAGDELFGGYNRYLYGPRFWSLVNFAPDALRKGGAAALLQLSPAQWNDIGRLPLLRKRVTLLGDKAHKMAVRLRSMETADDVYRSMVTEWSATEDPALAAAVLPTRLDDLSVIAGVEGMAQRMMLLDALTYLPDDILAKVDRAAMSMSLETRVPFLDHRLAEFAWRLPMSMKIRGGVTKWALRQILNERVPKKLIDRPKSGFGIPVGQWLRGPLRDWAEALLDDARLRDEGYLDVAQTRRLWREHQDGARDWTSRLWNILMFQAWLASQAPRLAATREQAES
jgi:asparagine synthase (glutamine-hydrolysing)